MRINRLFEIVYLLIDNKVMTAKELSERFEVSTRTIYRDVEILSEAGIPIYMSQGKGGGISLLPDYILDKTVFTKEEKVSILSSLMAMNSVKPTELDSALGKMQSLLGEMNADWIEVDFSNWGDTTYEEQVFNELKQAIIHRTAVVFTYTSGRKEEIKRKAWPLKLCFKGEAWYLYAYCEIRKDYRFFKLRRIRKLHVTEEHFEHKPCKKVLGERVADTKDWTEVTVQIDRSMAFRVYDEMREYTELDDGSFLCTFLMDEKDWGMSYLTSFGEHLKIVKPLSLREKIKTYYETILKNYR